MTTELRKAMRMLAHASRRSQRVFFENLGQNTSGLRYTTVPDITATQDESAYALEIPDLLSDYIRETQERDKAYQVHEPLTHREEGGARKGAAD
jgi:hypothetical protein